MGAGDTYARTCPSADSLAVGRLLNPKALRFPHPEKCCHLSPGALFSFQGFCGVGSCAAARSVGGCLASPSMQQEQVGPWGQTPPLLSGGAPGRSPQPASALSRGVRRVLALRRRAPVAASALGRSFQPQRVPPRRKGRAGGCPVEAGGFSSHCKELSTELRSLWQSNLSIRTLNRVNGPVQEIASS